MLSVARKRRKGSRQRGGGETSAPTEPTMFYFLGWVGYVRAFVKSSILFHMPKIFHIYFFKLGKTKGRGEHHHGTMLWSPAEMLSPFGQPGKGHKPRDCKPGSLGPGTAGPLVTSGPYCFKSPQGRARGSRQQGNAATQCPTPVRVQPCQARQLPSHPVSPTLAQLCPCPPQPSSGVEGLERGSLHP